jgi:hypothetical protein
MRSQMILVMANIGVERIAPGTPHIQYQKIVRAQAAVLVGALFDNRGGDRGPLGHIDRTAVERCVIPDMPCSLMRHVHRGRAGDDAVVVAGKLQRLVQGLPTAG